MQGDVHQHLVEGAVEEGRVDREDRVQSAGGQAGRAGDGVLLGDAHVEDPVREGLRERGQAHRVEHRGGDADDVLALVAERHHLLGEDRGPVLAGALDRQAGLRVDDADRVEAVLVVVLGGVVAAALLGQAVHDHRAAEAARLGERGLQGGEVVAVDRADVLEAEVLEHALRREVLEALLGAVQGLEELLADHRGALQGALAPGEEALVALGGAQGGEVVGEAADGAGVGALVVVDDDDQRPVLGGGDVVERLPGEAAGERAVADHRDGVPVVLAEQLGGLGQAVGVGERGGGVRVLDQVVFGLGP